VNIKTSVLHKICNFYTNLSIFFSVKTLRTIHEFLMVNLSYHNEYEKKFSTQIFTAVMVTKATKVSHFSSFSFRSKFGPRYLTKLLIFCNKIF